MAGNLKPANVGPEAKYKINDGMNWSQSKDVAMTCLFDGLDTTTTNASGLSAISNYWQLPTHYLDFTVEESFNIWALPVVGTYSIYNTKWEGLYRWDGSSWIDTGMVETERSKTPGIWTKSFENVPAGRYKVMGTSKAGENRRVEGEWYFEKAIALPATPMNLTATAGNAQVVLNWSAVTSATGYNVKRSATTGGPYTAIASNVPGTTYTDTGLTNGTTYYYVVTAVNASGESGNSNEASATPTGGVVPPVTDKAFLLTVEMREEIQREYVLSAANLNEFVAWYTARSAGAGPAYCIVEKPFNRKDYVAFSEIVTFEVADYSK